MSARKLLLPVRYAILAVLALAWVALCADMASACPSCKEAILSSEHAEAGGDIIAGFFWSILFMMSMPFAILGTFSGYMYLEVRRARAARDAELAAAREYDAAEPVDSRP